MLRGSGVAFDLRKNEPYEIYSLLNFKIPTSKTGDCLGRYYVRINELKESIKLILQILNKMPLGPVRINETKLMYKSNKNFKLSMENIIHHFKTFSN
jgi:NADH:ubiquinone oxidoreductase subunit D